MAKFQSEGATEEEAKAKAEAASPLMNEAREMLVKWEANDPEVRALWTKMNNWVYEGFDETYRKMGVSFDKIYYESNTYLEGKEKVMEGLEKGFFYKKKMVPYGLTLLLKVWIISCYYVLTGLLFI